MCNFNTINGIYCQHPLNSAACSRVPARAHSASPPTVRTVEACGGYNSSKNKNRFWERGNCLGTTIVLPSARELRDRVAVLLLLLLLSGEHPPGLWWMMVLDRAAFHLYLVRYDFNQHGMRIDSELARGSQHGCSGTMKTRVCHLCVMQRG